MGGKRRSKRIQRRSSDLVGPGGQIQFTQNNLHVNLPPKDAIESFERVVKGLREADPAAADAFMGMVNKEQDHRHSIEKDEVDFAFKGQHNDAFLERLGLLCGFCLMLVFIIGSIYLIAINKPVEGIIGLGLAIVGKIHFGKVDRKV